MARQTRKPDHWVIVDDGKVPLAHSAERLTQLCGIGIVQIVRRVPQLGDPAHTLSVNLLAGLEELVSDVVFIEDDDWYGPQHIEYVEAGLKAHEMFGFRGIVYYHVGKRCHRLMGEASPHSSLCQTGIALSVFPLLKRICRSVDAGVRNSGFVDLRLWNEFAGDKQLPKNRGSVVGIKGLPGRMGLTSGWRSVNGYRPDPSLAFLESLIGPDVENYRSLHVFHESVARAAPI
jgi:hypothetical protein